jgi:hypothetical protein
MTVYVDDVRHDYYGRGAAIGAMRMVMCHMWADSLEELLAMVDKIGVQRKWIQGHPDSIGKAKNASWVHFDIALGKKKKAIESGAVLTDKYGPLEFLAKRDIASGEAERVARGQAKLDQIAKCRALPKGTA